MGVLWVKRKQVKELPPSPFSFTWKEYLRSLYRHVIYSILRWKDIK